MKANPLPEFCKIANQKNCGVEVASGGELQLAFHAGIEPEHIVFTGPGKTYQELWEAIKSGIYMINVESVKEMETIHKLAKRTGRVVSVALRINPCIQMPIGKIQMGGTASQFGIEETELNEELFEKISNMTNICLEGIHIYMATSILDSDEICKNTEYAIRLGLQLVNKYSIHLNYLNVGGGFGIPYFRGEKALDIMKFGMKMKILQQKYGKQLQKTKVYFESGRFLLAECGLFLIRVLYRKESKGNTYLVCDGGSSFHASSAFLGRFVRGNFPMYVLGKTGAEKSFYVTGPSCTPTDLLGQNVKLPESTKEGDIIVIEKSGAYGLTYSPYGFLHHRLPLEIGYDEEKGFRVLGNHIED